MDDPYDVVIVGGSFAGLATAWYTQADNILILERQPELGYRQHSACAAPLKWVEGFGCKDSILDRFDSITFHTARGAKSTVELPQEFCTIDYQVFCQTMGEGLNGVTIATGEAVRNVTRGYPKRLETQNGTFNGNLLVDASGWRAVTAKAMGFQEHILWKYMASGIEIDGECDIENSLHVYYGKDFAPWGYAWIFPVGNGKVRVGLGSFRKVDLRAYLDEFISWVGIEVSEQKIRGGMIPCAGLREPVLGDVFYVGDSGGQVYPFTAEGIRPAFRNGKFLGELLSKVTDGEVDLSAAVEKYRSHIKSQQNMYSNLLLVQRLLFKAPDGIWDWIMKRGNKERTLFQSPPLAYFNGDLNYSKGELMKRAMKYLGLKQ